MRGPDDAQLDADLAVALARELRRQVVLGVGKAAEELRMADHALP